ncbi:hypothetical protein PROFUN_11169 [Planoprotostelium fungivorum]|uniref:Uncharacterized protein n=1 Tax=Planoprotostelium fungivorum TaxID=1890364 RepID=A0A2P6NAN3_9EUKA|nr:hypothetical protein PROFUN_11169 [Planoprotostelium fungivorum]
MLHITPIRLCLRNTPKLSTISPRVLSRQCIPAHQIRFNPLKSISLPSFTPTSLSVRSLATSIITEVPKPPQQDPLFSWEELLEIVKKGELNRLRRTDEATRYYLQFVENIKSKYGSIERFVLDVKLEWNIPVDSMDITPSSQFSSIGHPSQSKMMKNDFPYALPHDVEHWVLWSRLPFLPPFREDEDEHVTRSRSRGLSGITGTHVPEENHTAAAGEIRRFVSTQWPEESYTCAWLLNPPALQSVRGVSHFHMFVKRK